MSAPPVWPKGKPAATRGERPDWAKNWGGFYDGRTKLDVLARRIEREQLGRVPRHAGPSADGAAVGARGDSKIGPRALENDLLALVLPDRVTRGVQVSHATAYPEVRKYRVGLAADKARRPVLRTESCKPLADFVNLWPLIGQITRGDQRSDVA